ncbi:MBL fold metallo-hydrolase [Patulibacter sp. SYSU D01012]|uniref:MBL fold metallo-hydrolase n=1 Tax=Patulibacter sp. SYSU D01012 TaxID=2817381 RepID=UPI001B309770|nr:MBL fold metallo-hydrolase [Patulibacter sp. SYSU D01012]
MTGGRAAKELGRGERVVPGAWRLRLPLPWPGVPHGNAWAVAAGDGIVLFDTGMHQPGSLAHLERALDMVHLRLELVRHVVITHAHVDHCGQTTPVVLRSGADVWAHPAHGHLTKWLANPEGYWERGIEIALQSGLPEATVRKAAEGLKGREIGIAGGFDVDHELVDGVVVQTDLGPFTTVETPGHAPSHVCLFNAERRMLISGDHLLGRVSLFFDFGYTPDPVGEFLESLSRIEDLDARLVLSGHGRTFTDVQGHINANRKLVAERLARTEEALGDGEPHTAMEIAPHVMETPIDATNASWLLTEQLCFLRRLEVLGRVEKVDTDPDRFRLV